MIDSSLIYRGFYPVSDNAPTPHMLRNGLSDSSDTVTNHGAAFEAHIQEIAGAKQRTAKAPVQNDRQLSYSQGRANQATSGEQSAGSSETTSNPDTAAQPSDAATAASPSFGELVESAGGTMAATAASDPGSPSQAESSGGDAPVETGDDGLSSKKGNVGPDGTPIPANDRSGDPTMRLQAVAAAGPRGKPTTTPDTAPSAGQSGGSTIPAEVGQGANPTSATASQSGNTPSQAPANDQPTDASDAADPTATPPQEPQTPSLTDTASQTASVNSAQTSDLSVIGRSRNFSPLVMSFGTRQSTGAGSRHGHVARSTLRGAGKSSASVSPAGPADATASQSVGVPAYTAANGQLAAASQTAGAQSETAAPAAAGESGGAELSSLTDATMQASNAADVGSAGSAAVADMAFPAQQFAHVVSRHGQTAPATSPSTGKSGASTIAAGNHEKGNASSADLSADPAAGHSGRTPGRGVTNQPLTATSQATSPDSEAAAPAPADGSGAAEPATLPAPAPSAPASASDGQAPQSDQTQTSDSAAPPQGSQSTAPRVDTQPQDQQSSPPAGAATPTPNDPNAATAGLSVVGQSTSFAPPVASFPMGQVTRAIVAACRTQASSNAADTTGTDATGSSSVKTLEIRLDPANLGVLQVKMRLSGDTLELQVMADHQETLSLLKDNKDALSQSLQASGYKVDTMTLQASTGGAGSGTGQAPQGQGHHFGSQSSANGSSTGSSPQGEYRSREQSRLEKGREATPGETGSNRPKEAGSDMHSGSLYV